MINSGYNSAPEDRDDATVVYQSIPEKTLINTDQDISLIFGVEFSSEP
jgi:hypothetical protein